MFDIIRQLESELHDYLFPKWFRRWSKAISSSATTAMFTVLSAFFALKQIYQSLSNLSKQTGKKPVAQRQERQTARTQAFIYIGCHVRWSAQRLFHPFTFCIFVYDPRSSHVEFDDAYIYVADSSSLQVFNLSDYLTVCVFSNVAKAFRL